MTRRTLATLMLGLGVMSQSCLVFDDRCGERSRDVGLTGRLPNPDDPAAGFVQLTLVETETTEPRQSGYWLLIDESLRGHVTAARLRGTDGRLLVELEVEPTNPSSQVTYQGQLAPYNGLVSFADLYSRAASNQVTIVVRTDVAGRDSLGALLRVVGSNPWQQPHCS